jgi:hypothetical protein
MRLFRRSTTRALSEEMAYARCHGDRGTEILSVKKRPPYELPERRRGHRVSVAGEALRAAFAARLDRRLASQTTIELPLADRSS